MSFYTIGFYITISVHNTILRNVMSIYNNAQVDSEGWRRYGEKTLALLGFVCVGSSRIIDLTTHTRIDVTRVCRDVVDAVLITR